METVYFGVRDVDGVARVYYMLDGKAKALPLCGDECQHSLLGFEWGYAGSGPAQLAYALLRHCTGSQREASKYYQLFKRQQIAVLPAEPAWSLRSERVRGWLVRQTFESDNSDLDLGDSEPAGEDDSGVDLGAEF